MKSKVIYWMSLFLGLVVLVTAFLFPALKEAFQANPVFNGMIIGVMIVGIAITFRQVFALGPELAWLEERRNPLEPDFRKEPKLLAPLDRMLTERGGRLRISAMAARSMLDGVRMRLDEHRDISRYLIGLLIFLGLLGTFWGLLDTISSVGKVIAGLDMGGDDLNKAFLRLKENLQGPLAGMGTAFSSSLFGLGGSLILGFFDLQAGHAENRFFKELEDWLADMTHISSGPLSDGEAPIPAYIEGLLEKTADSLEKLERILSRSEEERTGMREQHLQLTRHLVDLGDLVRTEQQQNKMQARQQQDLQPLFSRLADAIEIETSGKESMRDQLHDLNTTLLKITETASTSQRELVQELRQELRLLTRTLAGRERNP